MRLRSRGLLVSSLDADLYIQRPELEAAVLDPLFSGGNVLVVGAGGSGKTTLLRKVESELDRRAQNPRYINASLARDATELVRLVLPDASDASTPLDAVRELNRLASMCILVDGPLPMPIVRELFGRLRDELWAGEHRWVLATSLLLSAAARLPPADAFWDRRVEIPPLRGEEVEELLRRGLDEHERADLMDAGWLPPKGPTPREVVREARAALEGTSLTPPDEVARLRDRKAGLERVPSMVLAELEGLGRPAAANDPELLERLGYSRAYVARALAELERAGLVQSLPAASDGPGRPAKLYDPLTNNLPIT